MVNEKKFGDYVKTLNITVSSSDGERLDNPGFEAEAKGKMGRCISS